jgi:hypothetical protein
MMSAVVPGIEASHIALLPGQVPSCDAPEHKAEKQQHRENHNPETPPSPSIAGSDRHAAATDAAEMSEMSWGGED